MIHSDWLENDSSMAPVAQESEMVELNWEQLEAMQGGWWGNRFISHICSVWHSNVDNGKFKIEFGGREYRGVDLSIGGRGFDIGRSFGDSSC